MSIALYRKYRPKLFSEVTNQNHIKLTLQNELENDRLAHAYLFCGPRGTGKTTLARLLSKAANCLDLQENGEPCNKCASCQEFIASKSLDIIEIDAASHTGVDNVRENIINNARFTPTKSKYKIFIIDEVHMLSISAFNALLKVLEEPPAHIIFILATTEIHKVPITIISRCQRFDFKKIIFPELVDRLRWIMSQEGVKVDDKVLELVAKNAGGCVRDAESLLEQILSLGEDKISFEQAELIIPQSNFDSLLALLTALLKKDSKTGVELVNKIVEEGMDIRNYYNDFLEFVRRVLVWKVTADNSVLLQDFDEKLLQELIKLMSNVEVNKLSQIIESLLKSKALFKQTHILQLPMEFAIIEITEGKAPGSSPKDESDRMANNFQNSNSPSPSLSGQEVLKPGNSETINKLNNKPINKPDQTINTGNNKPDQTINQPINKLNDKITNSSGLILTFNQVISRWPYIVKTVTEKNYTLGMSLSVAKPVSLENGALVIGFLFDLQKDRVDTPDNMHIIKDVILAELGARIAVSTIVDSSIQLSDITTDNGGMPVNKVKIEQTETKDPVDQALDAFGGTLVSKI